MHLIYYEKPIAGLILKRVVMLDYADISLARFENKRIVIIDIKFHKNV